MADAQVRTYLLKTCYMLGSDLITVMGAVGCSYHAVQSIMGGWFLWRHERRAWGINGTNRTPIYANQCQLCVSAT